MGEITSIEWADATWNPWVGCSKVSPGCDSCYMFAGMRRYGRDPEIVQRTKDATFYAPLKWGPRRIFTCSWSDFFHRQADPWREEAWDIMRRTPHLTYQVLTKRPGLAVDWYKKHGWLDNVWLGTSVESQKYAPRLDVLARVPAKVRFVSCEPLLSPLDLMPYFYTCSGCGEKPCACKGLALNWVIVGGESGPGARPMDLAWARDLVGQCQAAGVACFIKQLGSAPMSGLGDQDLYEELIDLAQTPGGVRLSDRHDSTFRRDTDVRRLGHYLKFHDSKGGDPAEWPRDLRVREMPV